MAILAHYNNIEVEIVNVLHTGDGRKRVIIRALEGKPFTAHSFNGGPMNTESAVVSPDLLTDVHQVIETVSVYGKIRRSRQPGYQRPEPVYVPFEDAPLYPVRARKAQPGRGGINND